jgi:hypothetical protein
MEKIRFKNFCKGSIQNSVRLLLGLSILLSSLPTHAHLKWLAADAARVAGTNPSIPQIDYTGTFTHSAYGSVQIREQHGQLMFNFHSFHYPLDHYHYDSFQTPDEPPFGRFFLMYETDSKGNLQKLRVNMPYEELPVLFTRQHTAPVTDLLRKNN